jgi:hypothetical protein
MSSAGHIYRESVITLSESAAGQRSYEIDVENDGIIISIEMISGSGEVIASLFSNLPDPMSSVFLGRTKVKTIGAPEQGAFITSRRVTLILDWTAAVECRLAIKRVSGSAVEQFINQQTPSDTSLARYQHGVINLLSNIEENQKVIINHLRQITEINDEEGNIF